MQSNSNRSKSYLLVDHELGMPEAIGDRLWLHFRPSPSKIVQRDQEIDEDVLVLVYGLDPFAQKKLSVMHLEILDDSLITRLKREVFNKKINKKTQTWLIAVVFGGKNLTVMHSNSRFCG